MNDQSTTPPARPDLAPISYCLASDYDAAHPGMTRYTGDPCADCVPVGEYSRIRRYLLVNPELVDDEATPRILGVTSAIYDKVVAYFRANQPTSA